jgi:hypothetical protein
MRGLPAVLLVWAATVVPLGAQPSSSGWALSGSGTDTTVSLDSDTVIRLSLAEPGSGGMFGRGRPRLVLSCRDHKLALGVVVGRLASGMTLRFGSEPAFNPRVSQRTKFGGLLSNSRKVVEPDTLYFDKPAEIVASFLRHRQLLLRLTPTAAPAQETTFSLAGLEAQIAPFEQACGLEEPLPRPQVAATDRAQVVTPEPAPARPGAAEERIGDWTVNRATSRVDDRPIVILAQAARTSAGAAFPPSARAPTLVLRCRERALTAFLSFQRPLFASSSLEAQVTVDDAKPQRWWFSSSTDGQAYFFNSAPQLLKRLMASRELRLRLGPEKRKEADRWIPEVEAVYGMAGLDKAGAALLEACPLDLSRVKVKDGFAALP